MTSQSQILEDNTIQVLLSNDNEKIWNFGDAKWQTFAEVLNTVDKEYEIYDMFVDYDAKENIPFESVNEILADYEWCIDEDTDQSIGPTVAKNYFSNITAGMAKNNIREVYVKREVNVSINLD